MTINIALECLSTPEQMNADGVVGLGFHDKIAVFKDDAALFHAMASGCPNCWSPKTQKWWDESYGWAGPGTYKYEVVEHTRFGKCLLINGGKPIIARNKNPNQGGRRILSEVFCHPGGTGRNKEWRGSGGCPTLPVDTFRSFISLFEVGGRGFFFLVDYLTPRLFYV